MLLLAFRSGAVLVFAGTLWLWLVQADWWRHKAGLKVWQGFVAATIILFVGAAINTLVGHALTRSQSTSTADQVRVGK